MTGKVVPGSISHQGATLLFKVANRAGSTTSVPVRYTGTVPDPFRDGREVIVTGKLQHGVFAAERNSLVTKCPSKFQNDKSGSTT
jgi:cytochrome c-type biogenesis protein CcmE